MADLHFARSSVTILGETKHHLVSTKPDHHLFSPCHKLVRQASQLVERLHAAHSQRQHHTMSMDTQPAAQATEALIHQYGRLVFQVIYGLTGDWHESEDLTQDTFLAAFKAIEAAQQASSGNFHAKAWLMQIAANNARMSLRRRHLVRFLS